MIVRHEPDPPRAPITSSVCDVLILQDIVADVLRLLLGDKVVATGDPLPAL